jgi:hypothetical protein
MRSERGVKGGQGERGREGQTERGRGRDGERERGGRTEER